MIFKEVNQNNYTVKIENPEIYIDNESRNRSGHMTHAMAEFAPGKIIDFNSNCSARRSGGHSTFGWVEYKISEDGGKTYSGSFDFPLSIEEFYDGEYNISVEKAVACDNGRIVAFCLFNDACSLCEPWLVPPTIVTSDDGGKTWSDKKQICPNRGRVYDVVCHKGVIYLLQFCNDATENFLGTKEEHIYRLYKSENNGESFEEVAIVPADTMGRAYGSILFDDKDILHMYTYNSKDEEHLDHLVSCDFGKTWEILEPCPVKQGARNPQTAFMDGVYFLHGRTSDIGGFVLYTSENGSDWDEGTRIENYEGHLCGAFYSNNIVLEDENGKFLFVQYSCPYINRPLYYSEADKKYYVATVNVKHVRVRIEK